MLININSVFFHNQQKKKNGDFFALCTRLPSSYDSDLEPFCSRQLRGLPSSDGYFGGLHSPEFYSSKGQTRGSNFNFFCRRTLQCGVLYISLNRHFKCMSFKNY